MNIQSFKQYVKENKQEFVDSYGLPMVYLHVTAGDYDTTFSDYHFNVTGDGDIILTRDITERPNHATYMRNTGSIAITLCCCKDAIAYANGGCNLGDYPPTDAQMNSLAQMIAILSDEFEFPITKDYVMTHGEAADIDGYGLYSGDSDCRWDLQFLSNDGEYDEGGRIIRGNAIFYQNH
jgi:hypothetical protein|nr:MAG TPA: N-acetylmuramoyl-L-alanine amidase [Caudoviricetes sp.]